MMEAAAQFPIGFVVALSGVLIPGPLLAYVTMKTMSGDARTGTFAAVGHIFVELVILSLVAVGLGYLIEERGFQAVVGALGGILLLIFGAFNLQQVGKTVEPKLSAGLKHHPIVGGVLFSTILNPGVILWWATVGVATLMEAYLAAALAGVLFWLAGHFLADLSWFSLVSYSVRNGRWLMGTKGYKALLIACGCVLLGFGVFFIYKFVPLLV
jgi:threonine/homoserine/homoserine lactone efflux protein